MPRFFRAGVWIFVALADAFAVGTIALRRGEAINAMWLVVAALCSYAIGYRFYSKFIAAKVLLLDSLRATPAERLENGRDFVPTNKWVVFGHHFAAIAGPGPLVGPVLAAQFGYLPGTLWILAGAVLGGCVQDFIILVFSVRRDGKSLCQMAKEEISPLGGLVAFLAIISIIVILLGVAALIVVNALKGSPWGTFTIAMTIPIALLMGVYLRYLRPGRVLETSTLGFVLVMAAVIGGHWIALAPTAAKIFTLSAPALAVLIIAYGYAASAMPIWLLLAPRDYLSTFVKLGTIAALASGIFLARPTLHMPAVTRFIDGSGPVFAGKIFPFAFIVIACGAISGFHALISSGTTPKLITHEPETRMVGYGAMACESFIAIMAMIAACTMQPGQYFAINTPAGVVGESPAAATNAITALGFPITAPQMAALAQSVGEQSLFNRSGGAPAFAVGMAQIFSHSLGGDALLGIWYHFAIMFEALFILTVLDAGTRVGRFMLQEGLGHFYRPLGRTSWYPSILASSALMVGAWGYLVWQGVRDPFGGIYSLWPLFGIANQLLAVVAFCVATTIVVKMKKARYVWITLAPLSWLVCVTFTAGYDKVLNPNPRIGFLADANRLAATRVSHAAQLIFNDRLDAAVTAGLVVLVTIIVLESAREWLRVLLGHKQPVLNETPFIASRRARESATVEVA